MNFFCWLFCRKKHNWKIIASKATTSSWEYYDSDKIPGVVIVEKCALTGDERARFEAPNKSKEVPLGWAKTFTGYKET